MHEYLFSPEVARVALVVSVVVSILFYERVQLTTGGAIVPAYLSLFLPAPLFVVSALAIAYLTYFLVSVVLAKRVILYGRRRFEVEVLVGLAIVCVAHVVALAVVGIDPVFAGLAGIGMLIPGVIAHDMFRQKPHTTLLALVATTAIVALVMFLFASLLAIAPVERPHLDAPVPLSGSGYPIRLILVGAVVSVLAGLVTFSRLGIRSGGFISAAYLALVVLRPGDLVFTAVLALATWWVVTRLVMPHLLVFGRRKLSTMILVGVILTWGAEILLVSVTDGAFRPWHGFVLIGLVVPALLANDAQRQGVERTLWGAAIATLAVFGTVNLVQAGLVAGGLV